MASKCGIKAETATLETTMKVRSLFMELIETGIVGNYATDENGDELDYRVGGFLADLDAPAEKLANYLNRGGLVGGVVYDGQRQGEEAPGLKFVSPEFVKVGGKWKRSGRATMVQVEATKGGHTGTEQDCLITVVVGVRFSAGSDWVKFQPKATVEMSCGCVNRIAGLRGTLATLSPNRIICEITGGCDDCESTGMALWNPAEMFESAGENGKFWADRLAVDPNTTEWNHHDSRPDNKRWQGKAGKGKRF